MHVTIGDINDFSDGYRVAHKSSQEMGFSEANGSVQPSTSIPPPLELPPICKDDIEARTSHIVPYSFSAAAEPDSGQL
jgi:hypothetical protein